MEYRGFEIMMHRLLQQLQASWGFVFAGNESAKFKVQFFPGSSAFKIPACV
jgi:hypothetical protein